MSEPSDIGSSKSSLEETVREIWQHALERPEIGREEDFLYLGGDSMRAALICLHLADELGIDVPLVSVFSHPTIASLTEYLRELNA